MHECTRCRAPTEGERKSHIHKCIKHTYIQIFHVALGWRRVPRAGRFRLLGGFIPLPPRAALKRMHLCPFGLLSSAVPFMALSHISPSSYGRCSLNSALLRMGMAVMARSLRPCHHPTSLHSQYPPMLTRTQPYLIRRLCAREKILNRFSVQYRDP